MADPLQLQPPLALDSRSVALDVVMQRISALDPAPVLTNLVDLANESVLEHLADEAHVRHTVAWRRAATVEEKRALVKASVVIHQRKGTLAGMKWAAASAGAAVVKAIRPPAKCFASPSMTTAERNAFVAAYPQLRIYRYRTAGQRVGAMAWRDFAGGLAFPVQSDAVLRMAPRSFVWRDGAEMALETVEREVVTTAKAAQTVTQVKAPGNAGLAGFCGVSRRQFPAVSSAVRRIYTMVLSAVYQDSSEILRRQTHQPGLSPIDVRYDQVAAPGHAAGLFIGQPLRGVFLATTSPDRLYSRLYLFDPGIAVNARAASLHCSGLLGMPRHHAELSVQIEGKTNPRAVSRFAVGFFVTQPQADLANVLEAMGDCARLSDRVAINTAVFHPVYSSESVTAGAFAAGDWTPR